MSDEPKPAETQSRRTVLRLAGASLPAFATFRASPAAAATSVLGCTVQFAQANIPKSGSNNQWITSSGTLTPAPNPIPNPAPANGPYPPLATNGYYTGQELKNYVNSGYSSAAAPTNKTLSNGQASNSTIFNAHAQYMNKMASGTSGYTCIYSVMH